MLPKLGRVALVLAAGAVLLAETGDAQASRYRRQYYSAWSYQPTARYYYRTYYFYPTPVATSYSHHYVVYYPSRPQYAYYYNPATRQYWGRVEFDEDGKPKGYSVLAPKDRKRTLADIPEGAFPPPDEMPPIPGSRDGEKMIPPPADLPNG